MIVIFDTNIWIQHLYLRAAPGVAARFYLAQKGAKVALPEVVRLEVEAHLRLDLERQIKRIQSDYDRVLALFGTLKQIVLPTGVEIEKKISAAFDLGIDLIEVPFCLESARNSFLKTINKVPPSRYSQQFKDGVLWADCLALLKAHDVVLVSDDKAFYEAGDHTAGLAVALRNEIPENGGKLTLLPRLADLLEEIRTDILLDTDELAEEFLKKIGARGERLPERNGFRLAERLELQHDLYLTEKSQVLFLEFHINYRCVDVSGLNRGDAMLVLHGDGLYDTTTKQFFQLGDLGSELKFRDEEGTEQQRRDVVIRVDGIVIGHRNITHTLRHKLA